MILVPHPSMPPTDSKASALMFAILTHVALMFLVLLGSYTIDSLIPSHLAVMELFVSLWTAAMFCGSIMAPFFIYIHSSQS